MRKIVVICIIIITTFYYLCNKISFYDLSSDRYINVEIKGNVESEKTLKLPIGSTIEDAIKLVALKEDSDLSSLSMLQRLSNNQIINIKKKTIEEKISINSADINHLCDLPGIGENIALRIIEYRKKYGSFIELDDLMNVKGIGKKKYESIKQFICL